MDAYETSELQWNLGCYPDPVLAEAMGQPGLSGGLHLCRGQQVGSPGLCPFSGDGEPGGISRHC